MPSIIPSRNHPSNPTQGDLDVLALLTSDSASLGPLKTEPTNHVHPHGASRRKVLPRRDSPLDPLLISAVLAGSGPMTRHHFGHGPARPGAYANCDNSRPSSPSGQPVPSAVVMKSCQAPRSERLRLAREKEMLEREAISGQAESSQPIPIPAKSPLSPRPGAKSFTSFSADSGRELRAKRRMSIDPAPVVQALQISSPTHSNSTTSIPATLLTPSNSSARPRVKCMARTRVPTPHGEVFLHLYHNDRDNKEHLALVIDPIQLSSEARARAPRGRKEIRSKTLDSVWREGETEMERVVRGAYVGRLQPGGEGQASDPQQEVMEQMDVVHEEDQTDILPLVRIHSECFTGETIGSMRCDCGEQLDEALRLIALSQPVPESKVEVEETPSLLTPAASRSPSPSSTAVSTPQRFVPGRGVVIYMRQEGRGIGLLEKIRAYNLQDLGHDTVTANLMLGHGADERKYNVAAEILRDLGLGGEREGIRLLTNNPEKVEGMAKESILISQRVGMVPRDWQCRSPKLHNHNHTGQLGDEMAEEDEEEKEYGEWRTRRAGVGMIGAGKTAGPELEKYLRTKVERMGHLIEVPKRS